MAIDYSQILRDNLRGIMRQKGITQSWLADQTGIPEATVSRYLSGVHSPKIEYVAKLAAAIGVSVDYLLGLATSIIPTKRPTPDIAALVAAYNRADLHTQRMVWMQLDLYLSDEEKALAPQAAPRPDEKHEKTETA